MDTAEILVVVALIGFVSFILGLVAGSNEQICANAQISTPQPVWWRKKVAVALAKKKIEEEPHV